MGACNYVNTDVSYNTMEPTINDLIFEFIEKLDEIYGVYLDSVAGFFQNTVLLDRGQQFSNEKSNLSIAHLDTLPYVYGKGAPEDSNSIVLHESTQGDYKKRNNAGGLNHIVIAHLCLTQIYQYWEDHYRSLIAESAGIKKEELKSDIFGDLRIYRNSIIHHRAIALSEIKKCKILKWHNEGDEIVFNEKQIDEVILNVKIDINSIPERYCS